jgi:hypothetical protein
MGFYECVIAIAAFLAGGAVGTFFLMVVGVCKGDRARCLSDGPGTPLDALTRRVPGLGLRP